MAIVVILSLWGIDAIASLNALLVWRGCTAGNRAPSSIGLQSTAHTTQTNNMLLILCNIYVPVASTNDCLWLLFLLLNKTFIKKRNDYVTINAPQCNGVFLLALFFEAFKKPKLRFLFRKRRS